MIIKKQREIDWQLFYICKSDSEMKQKEKEWQLFSSNKSDSAKKQR